MTEDALPLSSTMISSAGPSRVRKLLSTVKRKPLAAAGAIILISVVVVAVGADFIATHDPYSFAAADRLQGPSTDHFFGTDEFGRDVFSRVVHGSRVSLQVGLLAVAISTVVGTTVGIASGYFGGWFDSLTQRLVDMIMSFPAIVLALAIVAARGQGTENIVTALAVVQTPGLIRVVRANILTLKQRPFIEAGRVIGAHPTRIMAVHLLPNVASTIIVLATGGLGGAILAEATLSFLGLGTPPPQPSWGGMLSGSARRFATDAPWLVIFPGLALSLTIFSFNLFGDGLRDILDPRMRGAR